MTPLEFKSDAALNLTSAEVLQTFLDSFKNNATLEPSDDTSAGVIAAVVTVIVALAIIALIILAVYIYLRKCSNSKDKLK